MRLYRGLTALIAVFVLVAFVAAPVTTYACGSKALGDKAEVIKANAGGDDCAAHAATVKKADAKSCDGAKATEASADHAKDCTKPCTKPCPYGGATTTAASGSCTEKAAGMTTAAADGMGPHTTFGVAYLTCNGCATKVAEAIKGVDGVNSVGVSYKSGIADVDFDNAKCSSDDIIKAIENAGYHAQMGAYTAEELKSFAKSTMGTDVKVSNVSAGGEKEPASSGDKH